MQNPSRGKSGGAEIVVKADAEKALSALKLVEGAIAGVGSVAASSAKAVGQLGLSLLAATPKTTISAIVGVGKALTSVVSTLNSFYSFSQIPFVNEQLKAFAREGIEATKAIVPLSDLLKTIGVASKGIGQSYLKDGFLFEFEKKIGPVAARVDKVVQKTLAKKDELLSKIDQGFKPVSARIEKAVEKALDTAPGKFAKGVAGNVGQRVDQAKTELEKAFERAKATKAGKFVAGGIEKVGQKFDQVKSGVSELRKLIPPTPPPPPEELNKGDELIRAVKRARRTAVVQVKEFTQDLASRLRELVDQANTKILEVVGSLGSSIPQGIRDQAVTVGKKTLEGIQLIASSVASAFQRGTALILVPGKFREFQSNLIKRISDFASDTYKKLEGFARSVPERVAAILEKGRQNTQAAISKVFAKLLEGVGAARSKAASGFGKGLEAVKDFLGKNLDKALAKLPEFSEVKSQIKSKLDSVAKAFSGQIQKLKQSILDSTKDLRAPFEKVAAQISEFVAIIGRKTPPDIRRGFEALRKAFSDGTSSVADSLKGIGSKISEPAGNLLEKIKNFGQELPEKIQERLRLVKKTIQDGLKDASAVAESVKQRLSDFLSAFSQGVPDRIREGVGRLREGLVAAARQAADLIKKAWEKIPELMRSLGDRVPEQIRERFTGVKSRITDGLKTVGDALKSAGQKLLEIIRSIAGDFPEKVKEKLGGLRDSLAEGVKKAKTSLLGTDADLAPEPPKPAPWQEPDSKMKRLRERAIKYGDLAAEKAQRVGSKFNEVPEKFSMFSEKVSSPLLALSGAEKPVQIFESMKTAVGEASAKIAEASQQVFFFTSAFDTLKSLVANGPYQMLVGQNVELRKQLLETQASLVSTNKIMRDGQQITDPTSAIKALDAPVNAAIKKIRRDSLELVGVTSKDLVGVFNIINQGASQANISLKQSADLTSSFAAAMGTVGIPLFQARQEIGSILRAQIDQNSVLAKTLGLDNQRVRQLAQQGKLYDFLTDKLKAFRAGNALAAQTIEGVSSNIQEMFDNITMEAGAQLIEPIVEQLNRFYEAINDNRLFLTDYVTGLVGNLKTVGLNIAKVVEILAKGFGGFAAQIPEYLFETLANGSKQFAEALEFVIELFKPLIQLITMAAEIIGPGLISPMFKVGVAVKLASLVFSGLHAVLKVVMSMLPGLSTLINLVALSSNSMAMQFVNLTKQTGNWRVATGLLAAQELPKLQGVMTVIKEQLGPIGGIITPLIPQMSKFAIAVIGLNQQFGITRKYPIAKMFDEAAGAITGQLLPALSTVAKNKGLDVLSGQIDRFAREATVASASTTLMSKYTEVFSDVLRRAGSALAIKTMKVVAYTAVIAAAVIVLAELWKRSRDAGDAINKLADNIGKTGDLIQRTWSQTAETLKQPLMNEKVVDSSWIDKWIEKMREFEKSPAEALQKVNTLAEAVVFIFQVITQLASGAFKIIETLVRAVTGAVVLILSAVKTMFSVAIDYFQTFAKILQNPFDFKGIGDAIDGFKKRTILNFQQLGDTYKEISADTTENWKYGFKDLEKSSEETFREIGEALDKGEFSKNVQRTVKEIDTLAEKIKSTEGGSGALFSEALTPLNSSIAALKNGTGSIEEVRAALTATQQKFPELSKDLSAFSEQIGKEFPGDAVTASQSIKDLGESLLRMKSEGKQGVDGTLSAIERFQQGKGTISDVTKELALYRKTLTSMDEKKQVDAITAPVNALETALKGLDASASNRQVAAISASLDKDIEGARAQLQELDKLGQTNSERAKTLREGIALLETARKKNDAITESVKVSADPFLQLENQISAAKEVIEKNSTDIANTQKEATAKIRITQSSNLDINTGKEKLLTDSQARIEILKQETEAIKKEIPVRYKALQELLKLWNAMSPEEQESARGKDLKRQIDAEQAALYDASARGGEKRAELEKAIADKAIADIERANKLALEKQQQAESERLVMLTQMRGRGLITAEEFEKRKSDAAVESAKKELEEQEALVAKLEALPKPNDPDEAREREDRIRAEKLKTSQTTLKLIEAENAAYEAQTRKILASIEARADRVRAELERTARAGKITGAEKAEQEADLEISRIRAELRREKDVNKKADLRLQLEKAKTSKDDATRRRQQEAFDLEQTKAETEQLKIQREGGLSEEKTLAAAAAAIERKVAAARRGLAVARDVNEKAKAEKDLQEALLELQRNINDAEARRIDRNLKRIENSYKRQNNLMRKQLSLYEMAEKSLNQQKELIEAGNNLRQSVREYYDQTLGNLSSLEKSDYRRRQLAEVTATIKLKAAMEEVKIAEQTLAIEQQMKRLALEREKIQARIAENEKLGNVKRLEAEEKKAQLRGATPEELEGIRLEKEAAIEDYQLTRQSTALIDQQAASQEQIFEMQRRVLEIQNKGKVEAAATNLIQNMADPGNRYRAGEQYKEYLAQQMGAGSYQQLREGGLQSARDFQEQFFGQKFSRSGLQRDYFDINKAIGDRQNAQFIATLPGASQRPALPPASTPVVGMGEQPQTVSASSGGASVETYVGPVSGGDLSEIKGYVAEIMRHMVVMRVEKGDLTGGRSGSGVSVTIQSLNVTGNVSSNGTVDSAFSTQFRGELEKVFNEASRRALRA